MREDEIIIQRVILALNRLGLDYMLTGASAVIYYGRIRLTHDLDFVIELKPSQVKKLAQLVSKDFYFDPEMIQEAIRKRGQFNIIHGPTGLKFDFWLVKRDEYSQLRFKRRRETRIYNLRANIISPEDLIITKLFWFEKSSSEKHFEDALGVYQIQKGNLDEEYIKKWVIKQEIFGLWQRLKRGEK